MSHPVQEVLLGLRLEVKGDRHKSINVAVAYYHPRVIIFWVTPSVVRAMNAFPLFLADRSFVGTYAAALLAISVSTTVHLSILGADHT